MLTILFSMRRRRRPLRLRSRLRWLGTPITRSGHRSACTGSSQGLATWSAAMAARAASTGGPCYATRAMSTPSIRHDVARVAQPGRSGGSPGALAALRGRRGHLGVLVGVAQRRVVVLGGRGRRARRVLAVAALGADAAGVLDLFRLVVVDHAAVLPVGRG